MRKEEGTSKGKYPWFEDTDKRKYMMDKEILNKYIHLDNSCLTKVEKTLVRDLLYKYKDAFSLRDEIGLCPNIKIEIAFHSLRLTENSKKFCGILPYFGSPSYLCQRMPMGLNISPAIWQSYINAILHCFIVESIVKQ